MTMQAKTLDLKGKERGELELPLQFEEEIRPDIIKRAFLAIKSHKRQPYGSDPEAGNKHVTYWSKRRRDYRSLMGVSYPSSRTPRKIMVRRGSQMFGPGGKAPQTRGGRRAHPPKQEKDWSESINDKERRKAIRSCLAASLDADRVKKRHTLAKDQQLPLVVSDQLASIEKTNELKRTLADLGLSEELERASQKKIRAGKGANRGRKYARRKGPLLVVDQDQGVGQAAQNLPGVEVCPVHQLNAELMAPGAQEGRLVVWTEAAIKKLQEQDLFL